MTAFYTCPGEKHPISRSVHLARLAAFYPKCRNCPHRGETGQISPQTVERLQSTERRIARRSLFVQEGARGVYLNELGRADAARIAGAFASVLWDTVSRKPGLRPHAPALVVGYDERPSSPDIVTGAVSSLRRMGCQVIDIGLTTKPCFHFAIEHLQSDAGLFVTGGGCAPSWIGLDFATRVGGSPLDLAAVESRAGAGYTRATRRSGPHRLFQAHVPYRASLWKHFHALRPLRISCATGSTLIGRTLEQIAARSPCQLQLVPLARRTRDPSDPADADLHRLGESVAAQRRHLGILVDDDGERLGFVDENGRPVPPRDMLCVLAQAARRDQAAGRVVLEPSCRALLDDKSAAEGRFISKDATFAGVARAMRAHGAVFAGGESGRYWYRESVPICDAVVTVAKTLQALSRSDAPFSQVVAESAGRL